MSTFVLVHGAWHGGWCWDRLVPELTGKGHAAVAVDLPTTGDISDIGLAAGAAAVGAAVPDGDTVLVGHSMGALLLPLVAAQREVRHLVFVNAFVAAPGESMNEVVDREGDVFSPGWPDLARRQERLGGGASAWPHDAAIDAFFHDCAPQDAAWAADRLRPQTWAALADPCPVGAWPDVPSTYVLCRGDRVVNPVWSRRAAAAVLGVTPVELEGGHAPFLSRPAELATVLAGLAGLAG